MPKKPKRETAPAKAAPTIHEATLGNAGSVRKGKEITQAEAENRRKAGLDFVVCGPDRVVNRRLAGTIERAASGNAKCCFPHLSAGSRSLPHWQPDPRPPERHSFYETDNRQAI